MRSPGLHKDFYEPDKVAYVAVEADVDAVSTEVRSCIDDFLTEKDLPMTLVPDCLGKAGEGLEVTFGALFQLEGQAWTQVFGHVYHLQALRLAQELSRRLKTRAISMEMTDDVYATGGVFEHGDVVTLGVHATNHDIRMICEQLGLPVPEPYRDLDMSSWDDVEEDVYTYCAPGAQEHESYEVMAQRLGVYLHSGYLSDDGVYGIHDLDPEEIVRMDALEWLPRSKAV